MKVETDGEFSVYQWFVNGTYERVLHLVDVNSAVVQACKLATSAGAKIGTTIRVMITDGGDCSCWEWVHGEGIVFPNELAGVDPLIVADYSRNKE